MMNDLPKFYVREKTREAASDDTQNSSKEAEKVKDPELVDKNTSESNCSKGSSVNDGQMTSGKLADVSSDDEPQSPYERVGADLSNKANDQMRTLVKSPPPFNRNSILRDSMVGFRDGVPGTYSGYDQVTVDRKNKETQRDVSSDGNHKQRANSYSSDLDGKRPKSLLVDPGDKDTVIAKQRAYSDVSSSLVNGKRKGYPVRPPRKTRVKSAPSPGDESDYDKLWDCVDKPPKPVPKGRESNYSTLESTINDDGRVYDIVEEDRSGLIDKVSVSPNKVVVNSSSRAGNWVEGGVRVYDPVADEPAAHARPVSTVVLPISDIDDLESDSDSWGSEFDETFASQQRTEEDDVYELIGTSDTDRPGNRSSVYEELGVFKKLGKKSPRVSDKKKPPLPPRNSFIEEDKDEDADKMYYVDVNLEGMAFPPPILPPLKDGLSLNEVKRYQIIKCILENEKMYMVTLHRLIQDYEKPLRERKLINQDRIKAIFNHLSEIEQCHQLFNIALGGRMAEWNSNPNIGDIIYASTRLHKTHVKQTLYDLLKQPLERLPQLIVLLQELVKATPFPHDDRMPLQMALTQLECLSEVLCEKRRDMEMRHKVHQLDKYFAGLSKSLASPKRYYIRHDDMLLCKISHGQVTRTKMRRLFLLSDLLVCASIMNRSKKVASSLTAMSPKRYKVKWCVPIVDVELVEVGSGIHVDIENKTTTIKYTHPISSPRPGVQSSQKHLEDIQHDLAVIGQIAGLVASLRQTYDVINSDVMSEWYRQVKETLDSETERLNMHWLELSLPARDGRTNCLFYLTLPDKKVEWTAELDNAKLRLAYDNNPGWYLEDDESASTGGVAVLRRNLPLIANKVPLFMVEAKFTIECVLEITPTSSTQPILWIFSGNDHTGQITLMKMSMSSVPYVIESFVACDSRILCAEVIKDENQFHDPNKRKSFVWCGTTSGSVHIFDGSCTDEHKLVSTARLKDAVVCIRHICDKVFAGLANGTLACFRRKKDGAWDLQNPTVVCLGQVSVLSITEAGGRLWCGCGNRIFIIDINTLGIEHTINITDNVKSPIRHLVSYGVGVWASTWKSSRLLLYHCETFESLQAINIAMPLARMKHDVDSRVQNINLDKLHTTALLARGGLLWVGTDAGVILTYPLPRMGGVPQVSLRPCVSFHGHDGPVRCLHAFTVERNVRHKDMPDTEDGVAKSLFYTDPLEDSSGFSVTVDGKSPEDDQSLLGKSPDVSEASSEPYYFQVEPDEDGGTFPKTSDDMKETDSYRLWLKTFGRPPNKIDPLISVETRPGRSNSNGNDSYNSDESVDSDQEFSFIEDRERKIPTKVKKKAATILSVDVKPNGEDNGPAGIVKSKTLQGPLPAIDETDFANILESFEGFEGTRLSPKASTPTKKGDSGYEEPISNVKPVKDPYATVKKAGSGKENDSVVASQSNASQDVEKHYKYAPLPQLPGSEAGKPSTLLEIASKFIVNDGNLNDVGQESAGEPLKLNDDTKRLEEEVPVEDARPKESGDVVAETTVKDLPSDIRSENIGSKPVEQSNDLHENAAGLVEQVIGSNKETMNLAILRSKEDMSSDNDSSTLARESKELSHCNEKQEKDKNFDEMDSEVEKILSVKTERIFSSEDLSERELRSPVLVKVTDLNTQQSIEGAMDTDTDTDNTSEQGTNVTRPNVIQNDKRDGVDQSSMERPSGRIENKQVHSGPVGSLPNADVKDGSKRSNSLGTLDQGKESTDDSIFRDKSSTFPSMRPLLEPLDLTPVRSTDIKPDESAYTPLLPQAQLQQSLSNTSDASSLSGAGTLDYDKAVAFSTSLIRESPKGYYATLVSVSRKDVETRRQLLLKPTYVISVGPGHVDLRRKTKVGLSAGVGDFFRSFTASNPGPQLIFWKLTA